MKSFMINQQTCLKVTITKLLDKDGILVQPQIMKDTQQSYPLSLFIPGSSHLALCPWKGGDNRFVKFSAPIYNKLKCIAPIWLSVSPTHLFSLFDFFYVYLSCLYVPVYTMLCVQRSDDTWGSPASNLQHVGPGEETQMARLGDKCLHLLNPLTSNPAFYSSPHLLLTMSSYFRIPLISLPHSYPSFMGSSILPIIPLSTPLVQASPRTFRGETGSPSFQNPVYAFIWNFAAR